MDKKKKPIDVSKYQKGGSVNPFDIVPRKGTINRSYEVKDHNETTRGYIGDEKPKALKYEGDGLDVINDLVVTTYNRKDDLSRGINKRELGFIAEDSPKIASPQADGLPGINNYLTVSYLVKAVQELSTINTNTNKRINTTDSNMIKLVANDSIYGLRLNHLETEVFRLKKRIEELEKIA